ncbi:MAG: hypothetical protein LBS63_02270 [Prevotellaceae bacterium]|jgi:hypothetical protein|nr:hypothetical protein [Prevotellaceae bacterium]
MYSTRSGLVLGFHGCDKSVADAVLSGAAALKSSTNSYDWLGYGIVQICVRNPNCIKGFFVPREIDYDYPKV